MSDLLDAARRAVDLLLGTYGWLVGDIRDLPTAENADYEACARDLDRAIAADGGEVGGWKMDVPVSTRAGDCAPQQDAPRQADVMLSVGPGADRYDVLLQLKAFETAIVEMDCFPPPPREPGDG